MNLQNMHIWFRQYAQRMGLQNVRALLPDQIDIFINTSIDDYVNELIRNNVGVTNDRVITDNSKIGTINALRTLYKVDKFNVVKTNDNNTFIGIIPLTVFLNASTNIEQLTFRADNVDFTTTINFRGSNIELRDISELQGTGTFVNTTYTYDVISALDDNNLYIKLTTSVPNINNPVVIFASEHYTSDAFDFAGYDYILSLDEDEINSSKFMFHPKDVLFYSDFAVNYKSTSDGIYKNGFGDTIIPIAKGSPTNFYPIRIIDDIYLADVLQDFILKPTLRSPVITFHTIVENDEKKQNIDIYFGTPKDGINKKVKGTRDNPLFFNNNLVPYQIRMSYISKPAKVQYNEDQLESNVDCDLPENTHVDILKHAVDLYRLSMQGSVFANQQQQQVQNQELARNNARAEGYAPATT